MRRRLMLQGMSRTAFVLLGSLLLGSCASGAGAGDGGPGHDGGPAHDGGHGDGGDAGPPRDMSVDGTAGDLGPPDMGTTCGGVMCMAFEYCMAGHCTPYPACAPDGSCPAGTDICRSRHCVPRTSDIDGDGVTAATDCDETNPMIHPGATEICNGIDDNCNGSTDEGSPMCPPGMGVCMMGHCGCPPDHFDLDMMSANGCECAAMPVASASAMCGMAQDLGSVADTGAMAMVSGNALPMGREVWYKFHAVDTPDTSCDMFNVHVSFTTNPGTVFELTVFKGMCGAVECGDTGFVEYNSDMHMYTGSGAGAIGECPCAPAGSTTVGVNTCTDDSQDFYVRVRRKTGSAVACAGYTLLVTNGI